MKRAVRSRRKVYGQLLDHARRQPHRECCGILAGKDGLVMQAFPAKNGAADPVRNYEIAPKEMVRLLGELRERRLEFLGIYHSHPNWRDTNEPSPKDIALAHHAEAIYFIVTPRPYATTPVRAFSIRDGHATELEIQVLPWSKTRSGTLEGLLIVSGGMWRHPASVNVPVACREKIEKFLAGKFRTKWLRCQDGFDLFPLNVARRSANVTSDRNRWFAMTTELLRILHSPLSHCSSAPGTI